MNTPVPANVRESLKRLARDAEFQKFAEHLRVKLEDTKTALVKASPDMVGRLQGYAQALTELVDLVK